MEKRFQIVGLMILIIASVIYDFKKPEVRNEEEKSMSYVLLEGEFLQVGKFEFEGKMTVQDLVDCVGVSEQANLEALSLSAYIEDESRLYLPSQKEHCVSLNHATKEELMTLKGIGEKTALKIIAYRELHTFEYIEDIMNISGIGEKTYLKLRDELCL